MKERESSEEDGEDQGTEAPGFLTQDKVKDIMRQILTGLAEMHEVGVWHRDVKTGNIMFDVNDVVKFIDFNISKLMDDSISGKHTKNVVTRNFRPPEIFFGDTNYDGARVDVWSAGCVFAELLVNDGSFFAASSDIEQLCNIFDVTGTPKPDDWPEVEDFPTYLPFNPCEARDLATVIRTRRDQVK